MLNEIATSLIGICISNSSSQVYYHGTRKPVSHPSQASLSGLSFVARSLKFPLSHAIFLSHAVILILLRFFARFDNFTSQSIVFHVSICGRTHTHTHTHPFEHVDTHTYILFLLLLSFLHTHARIVWNVTWLGVKTTVLVCWNICTIISSFSLWSSTSFLQGSSDTRFPPESGSLRGPKNSSQFLLPFHSAKISRILSFRQDGNRPKFFSTQLTEN